MVFELVDKLVDRIIQLAKFESEQRKKLTDEYVKPVFTEFEQVHAEYLSSFNRYRDLILTDPDPEWIPKLREILRRDNLFTANYRSKLMQLAEASSKSVVERFAFEIQTYLMEVRLVEPLGKQIYPQMIQRWRQGFERTLGEIADERWQMVIDPDGARPPLYPEEIQEELNTIKSNYSYSLRNWEADQAVKRACALWSLDKVVGEMQAQYERVCTEYAALKEKLA